MCIFDLWNNVSTTEPEYGRFLIEYLNSTDLQSMFEITYRAGMSGTERVKIGMNDLIPESLNLDEWNHFAFTVQNNEEENSLLCRLHINGELIDEVFSGSKINGIDSVSYKHLTLPTIYSV